MQCNLEILPLEGIPRLRIQSKMGKRKREQKLNENGEEDLQNSRTAFVNNLPYSFTNAQLEEAFSQIGPVRRCFMVKPKGSEQHRGFGFVQFAIIEDAKRAVEGKNGSIMGGRKIKVDLAKHRPSIQQRRGKTCEGGIEGTKRNVEDHKTEDNIGKSIHLETHTKKRNEGDLIEEEKAKKPACNHTRGEGETKAYKEAKIAGHQLSEVKSSAIQRVARTVVFGGLIDRKMTEAVLEEAKKAGPIESVTDPLPEYELQSHGLASDGCKAGAVAVLYVSVRSAHQVVATLHQRKLEGGLIWARQLGGEGSKLKKWRLIVRNLPFQANGDELRKLFSTAGFVWNVTIPQGSDGRPSKGFAFVTFTCKRDAEKAIQTINGTKIGKRPIAVDWAVSKKKYETALTSTTTATTGEVIPGSGVSDLEDNETASEDEDSDSIEEHPKSSTQLCDNENDEILRPDNNPALDPDDELSENFDILKEMDIARKVLSNIIDSGEKGNNALTMSGKNDTEELSEVKVAVVGNKMSLKEETIRVGFEQEIAKTEAKMLTQASTQPQNENSLQRTIFISNLPFEVDNEEIKTRFTFFGKIKSVHRVLHQLTKRPKGTAFVEFETIEGAEAAISAAEIKHGLADSGIIMKGRPLTVFRAMDKTTANQKAKEKTEKPDHDHRNLYLTKEGLILEGTPAAEGVSREDMSKRQLLAQKKAIKLRSPNFHVSKTRLAMYNVPKSMTEKELKKLSINAVLSRATKQNPVIKQVKILKDIKKLSSNTKVRSHGVAFVEFTEHEHALVALRVLNNNPETFGPEHRPIVEFAIEDVRKLQKLQQAKSRFSAAAGETKNVHVEKNSKKQTETNVNKGDSMFELSEHVKEDMKGNTAKQKRKDKRSKKTEKNVFVGESALSQPLKEDTKGNAEKQRGKDKNRKKTETNVNAEDSKFELAQPLKEDTKGNARKQKKDRKRRSKLQKGSPNMEDNNDLNKTRKFAKQEQTTVSGKREALPRQAEHKGYKSASQNPPQEAKTNQTLVSGLANRNSQSQLKEGNKKLMKRKLEDRTDTISGKQKSNDGKRPTKKKKSSAKEVEDNLDKLVARYRSKLFSDNSKNDSKQTRGDLKRWFE